MGVSDLVAALRALPPFTRRYNSNSWYRYLGDPDVPEQEAELTARSPSTMVDRIRTPLLVAQGANDVRVPQAQSDRIVASLRERGVPVESCSPRTRGTGSRTNVTGSGCSGRSSATSPSIWVVGISSSGLDR